jgi:hypothetical protein
MFVYQWIRIRMNERIEKFARESGAWHQVYDQKRFMHDHNFDIERFARLIVRECAQVCRDQPNHYALKADRDNCAIAIEEHFGVEE